MPLQRLLFQTNNTLENLPVERNGITMNKNRLLFVIVCLIFMLTLSCCQHQRKNSVVLVSPEKGLDYLKLDGLLKVYDHYFEPVKGAVQHRLIGKVMKRNLHKLAELPLSYRVLDENLTDKKYYWVYEKDKDRIDLKDYKAKPIFARRDEDLVLVALTDKLAAEDRRDLKRIVPLIFNEIPIVNISPENYSNNDERIRSLPPGVERKCQVGQMINNIDPDECERLVRELTGNQAFSLNGQLRTIESRYVYNDDANGMPLLTDWLYSIFTDSGIRVDIDELELRDGYPFKQLVVTIDGTDLANELFIVTSHIDTDEGSPGADDNASGVAAMICAAKELAGHTFRRTVKLLFTNAEEHGARGSVLYLLKLVEHTDYEIYGAYNFDTVAYDQDDDDKFQIQSNPGDSSSEFLRDRLAETIEVYEINLVPKLICDDNADSDHGPFWNRGIPAVWAGEEMFCEEPVGNECRYREFCTAEDYNPNIGTPDDDIDKIKLNRVTETAKAITGVVAYAAEIQEPDIGNCNDFTTAYLPCDYHWFEDGISHYYEINRGMIHITARPWEDLWGGEPVKRGAPIMLRPAPAGDYEVECDVSAYLNDDYQSQRPNTQIGLFVFEDVENWMFFGLTNHDTSSGASGPTDGLIITLTDQDNSQILHEQPFGPDEATFKIIKTGDLWRFYVDGILRYTRGAHFENHEVGIGVKSFQGRTQIGYFDNFCVRE